MGTTPPTQPAPPSRPRRASLSGGEDRPPTTAVMWERDWRGDVMRQLRESADAHQQTAVILERLSNRLDEHDRRITALESAPAQEQKRSLLREGLNLQALYVGLAAAAVVISLLSPHINLTLH